MPEREAWCPSCNGLEVTCADCDGTGYVIVEDNGPCTPMRHGCTGPPHHVGCPEIDR